MQDFYFQNILEFTYMQNNSRKDVHKNYMKDFEQNFHQG